MKIAVIALTLTLAATTAHAGWLPGYIATRTVSSNDDPPKASVDVPDGYNKGIALGPGTRIYCWTVDGNNSVNAKVKRLIFDGAERVGGPSPECGNDNYFYVVKVGLRFQVNVGSRDGAEAWADGNCWVHFERPGE